MSRLSKFNLNNTYDQCGGGLDYENSSFYNILANQIGGNVEENNKQYSEKINMSKNNYSDLETITQTNKTGLNMEETVKSFNKEAQKVGEKVVELAKSSVKTVSGLFGKSNLSNSQMGGYLNIGGIDNFYKDDRVNIKGYYFLGTVIGTLTDDEKKTNGLNVDNTYHFVNFDENISSALGPVTTKIVSTVTPDNKIGIVNRDDLEYKGSSTPVTTKTSATTSFVRDLNSLPTCTTRKSTSYELSDIEFPLKRDKDLKLSVIDFDNCPRSKVTDLKELPLRKTKDQKYYAIRMEGGHIPSYILNQDGGSYNNSQRIINSLSDIPYRRSTIRQ